MFKAPLKNTLKILKNVAYILGTSPILKTVVIIQIYNNNISFTLKASQDISRLSEPWLRTTVQTWITNGPTELEPKSDKISTIQFGSLAEGSLEVKLPTRWTDGKAQVGRVREEKKKEDQKRESLRRKRIQVRKKVGKSQNIVFFQWFVAPEAEK